MTNTSEEAIPLRNRIFVGLLIVMGILIVILLLTGQPKAGAAYRPASFEFKDLVKSRLKDPDSAKFSNEEVYQWQSGSYAMCGYVNAKNSFGGYAGNVRFVAAGQVVMLENEDGAQGGIFTELWRKTCHNGY